MMKKQQHTASLSAQYACMARDKGGWVAYHDLQKNQAGRGGLAG
jgi:hypothetical protein